MAEDLRIFSMLVDFEQAGLSLSDAAKVIAMLEACDAFDAPEHEIRALGQMSLNLSAAGSEPFEIALAVANAVSAADERGWVIGSVPSPDIRTANAERVKTDVTETLVKTLESVTGMSVKLIAKDGSGDS